MWYRSKVFQIGLKAGVFCAMSVFGLAQEAVPPLPLATTPGVSGSPVSPMIISGRQEARAAARYSAGIAETIKLLNAKMDAQVILAYIQNSPTAYNPDATELIALKEHGATPEVLTALLQHGNELRQQMVQAQSQNAANPQPAVPANIYAPTAVYPVESYGYGGSYYAPYPTPYYGYGFSRPLPYRPPIRPGAYRPYGYGHGRFPAALGSRAVSVAIGGRASFPAMHAGGVRGSGHPGGGGRPGGRAR